MTVGPDGNAYIGLRNVNKIARVTAAGVVTEFTIPTPNSLPTNLTPGPDGNVWFSEGGAAKIGPDHLRWRHHRVPHPLGERSRGHRTGV